MASWYIDPGLGSGTNAGTTWANAFNNAATAWADAITASAAGDDFYVNAASTCTNTTSQTLTFKGTAASPNRIFSCSTITTNPPVTADLGAGAAYTTTGASSITVRGYFYMYGVVFNVGTGTSAASFSCANTGTSEQTYDACAIKLLVTTATGSINVGSANNNKVTLNNTPVTFNGGTGSGFVISNGPFIWKNTASAVLGTQSAISNLIQDNNNFGGTLLFDSVDFKNGTGIASGKNLVGSFQTGRAIQFINCLITAGVLIVTPTTPLAIIDQIVTDSTTTNYLQQRNTYQGVLTADTTHYNNATDGTTAISWKVITTANAKPATPFECFQIVQWVAAGTYANSKVFISSATASLKTNDVWVDVQYLGSSYALGSPATSFGAGSGTATLPQIPGGTTPGTLAASSPAWGTSGLGNDYQLAIPSFTTSAAGYVRFTVRVGKASLTVYIDPAVTVAA